MHQHLTGLRDRIRLWPRGGLWSSLPGGRKTGVVYWRKPSRLSLLFSILAVILVSLAVLGVAIPKAPAIWYLLRPGTSGALAAVLARPAVTFGDLLAAAGEASLPDYQPPLDTSLPPTPRIQIPKIGVETGVVEAAQGDYEDALRRGVWRVPDFGTPAERRLPTILVAHRYGYLSWSDAYRRQNSFYNLPKLAPGDRLEIIWGQRRYVYEIYGGDEGEAVSDYSADLILYTCRFLESPIRIFRYAKLVREV